MKGKAVAEPHEEIFESPASDPDEAIWLEQGRLMLTESLESVRSAANGLLTALGLLEAIYLGIIGFAQFIPATCPIAVTMLFFTPLLLWLVSIYFCVLVLLTKRFEIRLHAPQEIKALSNQILQARQRYLMLAFWTLAAGLLSAFALMILRLKL